MGNYESISLEFNCEAVLNPAKDLWNASDTVGKRAVLADRRCKQDEWASSGWRAGWCVMMVLWSQVSSQPIHIPGKINYFYWNRRNTPASRGLCGERFQMVFRIRVNWRRCLKFQNRELWVHKKWKYFHSTSPWVFDEVWNVILVHLGVLPSPTYTWRQSALADPKGRALPLVTTLPRFENSESDTESITMTMEFYKINKSEGLTIFEPKLQYERNCFMKGRSWDDQIHNVTSFSIGKGIK